MNMISKFLAVMFLSFIGVCAYSQDDAMVYHVPEAVQLSLSGLPAYVASGSVLTGELSGIVGENKNIKISFISSPDIEIRPSDFTFSSLKPGEKKLLQAKIQRNESSKASQKNRVMMLVEYLPDYNALINAIQTNQSFSNSSLRSNLLQNLQSDNNEGKLYKDSVELTFLEGRLR
ncbi:MAG: hypothetical protein HQM10_08095 [Candidatus Riflebacteria bacterium]|nr:hypothetical protein [Candidatus Riflebacteria bacterium]